MTGKEMFSLCPTGPCAAGHGFGGFPFPQAPGPAGLPMGIYVSRASIPSGLAPVFMFHYTGQTRLVKPLQSRELYINCIFINHC